MISKTSFHSDHKALEMAFRIAIGDLYGNIFPYTGELQETEQAVLLAGTAYDRPWTRDAAINVWNGLGLISREVSKNTLVSMLCRDERGIRIGGQYWDAIIWVSGAWSYYLYSGDRDFLTETLDISLNSLRYFEENEFDSETGLFRGAPCYADGISAYPDRYTAVGPYHDIQYWAEHNRDLRVKKGEGLPIQALSTNCLYYQAYKLLSLMAEELHLEKDPLWKQKEGDLKEAINRHLWIEEKGFYRYFIDPWGGSEAQDGLGHSLAVILGVADEEQKRQIMNNQHVSPAGIPCLWPVFERYSGRKGHTGRHNGTVWPHIQGFWGSAAVVTGRYDLFEHELLKLTEHVIRDGQFAEVYHPETGIEYGGIQENSEAEIQEYFLCHRQSWSASAYLRLIFTGVMGMSFTREGILFSPRLPEGCNSIRLRGIEYRDCTLEIRIEGEGESIHRFSINGRDLDLPLLPEDLQGKLLIEIFMRRESSAP